MKTYLIKIGDIFKTKRVSGFVPKNYIMIVPESVSHEDYPYLYAVKITDQETGAEVWDLRIDSVTKGNSISQETTKNEKSSLHQSYISDINTEMLSIFGTIDRDKASAMYNTWKEWKDDPSFFADKGLFDEFGLALDTAAKIATYANQKLSQTKQYSVFLMTREKEFRDAVALLGE